MESKITVLLVDDHALVRRGVRRLLEDEDCISVVGEADNGVRAVQMVGELSPQIVLMDCSMPDGDGVAAAKEISRTHPETSVLMLSMHSEEALVRRAMELAPVGTYSRTRSSWTWYPRSSEFCPANLCSIDSCLRMWRQKLTESGRVD
jgi:DNA-binding NarL/FixJ family response regulator